MRALTGLAGVATAFLLAGTLAVPAATAGTAQPTATVLYVDQVSGCSNSGPGSQAVPFCSVQAAANVVNPGQTVDIESDGDAQYYELVTMTRSGTPSAPITFTGVRRSGQLLPLLYPARVGSAVLTLKNVHDVTIESMGVDHWDSEDGIDVVGSQDITFDHVDVAQEGALSSASAGISVNGTSSAVTVSRSEVLGENGYAVRVQPGAQGVTVTTNEIIMGSNSGSTQTTGIAMNGTGAVTSNSASISCGTGADVSGSPSATIENNIFDVAGTSCATPSAALSVAADSVSHTLADYNALYASGTNTEYSWAGTTYADAAAFHTATGQGAQDQDTTPAAVRFTPPEGSPLIDSADCAAPGELATDISGNPRVRDPLVAATGTGTCYADRGAHERQDSIAPSGSVTPSSHQGSVPFSVTVTMAAAATSPWNEPVSYAVDFGDGGGPSPVAASSTTSHVYTTPGVYTITMTASDTGGTTTTVRQQLVAGTPTGPVVTLTAGPDISNTSLGPVLGAGQADFTISAGADTWELASGTIAFGDGTSQDIGTEHMWNHLYPGPGTYKATLTETDLLGRTSTATATVTVGDEFIPDGPYQDYSGIVRAHGVLKLSAATLNANFSSIRAAYLDVTVSNPKMTGSLFVYPDGTARPADAAVQFAAGRGSSNTVLADPTVDFYNASSGPIGLTVHTYGLEVTSTSSGGQDGDTYAADGPVRVLGATTVPGGGYVTLPVAGRNGVPAKADAVVLDVTASGTRNAGYLTAYAAGTPNPGIHHADWVAGQMATGLAVVPLTSGKVVLHNSSRGSAVFTADVVGYFNYYGTASVFLPVRALRLLDVRIGARSSVKLRIGGRDGLPASGTSAAAVDLTAGGASRSGTIVGWADGTARPVATSISYDAGSTAADAALIPVGSDGEIDLFNAGPSAATLIVDLNGGYYRYGSAP
ncbi:MAG TPA: PKD domain-containing protein [Streptosporangiaceae bacterium]